MIGRFVAEGFYVGRDLRFTITGIEGESITLRIEGPTGTVVTDSDLGLAGHLVAVEAEERRMGTGSPMLPRVGREYIVPLDAGVWIGRGVEVTLIGLCGDGEQCACPVKHGGRTKADIAVEASRWMQVTRDDFTNTEHLRFQDERDQRNGAR